VSAYSLLEEGEKMGVGFERGKSRMIREKLYGPEK